MDRAKPWLWLGLVPLIFFVWGVVTLSDYGVNTDEPAHFMRGQAYLNYFLTGSKTYNNVPGFADYYNPKTGEVHQNPNYRISVYQNPTLDFGTFADTNTIGHPPISDILAALSNKVFYQQLGWLGDVPSYHLFEIAVATFGIGIVMWWAYLVFGWEAALIAGVALALHPMYLGESRFNIKDPAETAWSLATVFAIWQATVGSASNSPRWRPLWWLLAAGFFGGLALATKFNILFIGIVLPVWIGSLLAISLVQVYRSKRWDPVTNLGRVFVRWPIVAGVLLAVVIALVIFFGSWPYLWANPISRTGSVIDYYQSIGAGTTYVATFVTKGGWNLYPLLDAVLRTPGITLVLAAIGAAGFVRYRTFEQRATLVLWLISICIAITRVSTPTSSVYGSTRQIMGYVPRLALFAGVGGVLVIDAVTGWLKRSKKQEARSRKQKIIMAGILVTLYLPIVVTLIRYNPNPQLYYNSLIGGLKGAQAMNFPYWNNTMNNAYVAGIDWLNANAAPNSKVGLITSLDSSVPPHRLRNDIQLNNGAFSGPLQEGEYLMETLPIPPNSYEAAYVSTRLTPVYTYTVDGVGLLSVWRNDPNDSRQTVLRAINAANVTTDGHSVALDFGRAYQFDRLELNPADSSTSCAALSEGSLSVSIDGKHWQRLANVPDTSVNRPQFTQHAFPDYFMNQVWARFVSISPNSNACILHPTLAKGWVLGAD